VLFKFSTSQGGVPIAASDTPLVLPTRSSGWSGDWEVVVVWKAPCSWGGYWWGTAGGETGFVGDSRGLWLRNAWWCYWRADEALKENL